MTYPVVQSPLIGTFAPTTLPVKRLSIRLAAVLLVACGGGGSSDSSVASFDSAGTTQANTQPDPQAVDMHMHIHMAAASASLSPSTAAVGSNTFTLEVTGSHFISGSLVKWNNGYMPTTFVNAIQLNTQVPASKLAKAGVGAITVVTGNVTTNTVKFVVNATATDTGTGGGTGTGSGGVGGASGAGGGTGTGPGTGGTGLALRVNGNHFVDAAGAPVQSRGANVSVLEYWLIQGQNPAAPWGGQPNGNTSEPPDFSLMARKWAMNVVRLPEWTEPLCRCRPFAGLLDFGGEYLQGQSGSGVRGFQPRSRF